MKRSSMEETPEEIQRQEDYLEKRKEAIAREIHRKDQIQRELDAFEKGFEEGKAIAKAGFRVDVILNLHKERYPLKIIADITSLSTEEVQHIINYSINKL